jgi:hypothetical protein
VPDASKNLVSVHKFTYDNDAFFEFHPWHFSLKDRDTKRLLLQGRCKDGLYPLPLAGWLSQSSPNKSVLEVVKPTLLGGIIGWDMLPLQRRSQLSRFVMPVNGGKVISYSFLSHQVYQKLP